MNQNNLLSLFSELEKISITHVCDAYADVRLLNPLLRPVLEEARMIGTAFTVRSHGDLLPIIKAIDTAPPGAVIVIESNNASHALAGEIFSTAAKERGLAGIVIDGYCRDINSIRSIGLPIYARGVCPKAGTKEKLGELQVDITCGDVTISPGEIVFGDENGVIVCSMAELTHALPLAMQISLKEKEALRRIALGVNLVDMFNFEAHCNNILSNRASRFSWVI